MLSGALQVLLRSIFFVAVAWHFLLASGSSSEPRQVGERTGQSTDAARPDRDQATGGM
jgi:hypothetical protein